MVSLVLCRAKGSEEEWAEEGWHVKAGHNVKEDPGTAARAGEAVAARSSDFVEEGVCADSASYCLMLQVAILGN